jgi:hypothetical protein
MKIGHNAFHACVGPSLLLISCALMTAQTIPQFALSPYEAGSCLTKSDNSRPGSVNYSCNAATLPDAPTPQFGTSSYLAPGISQPAPYEPLTSHQKFEIFTRRTYSPFTFFSAAFDAAYAHVTDSWPDYGHGASGYGKRYGATIADAEARSFFQSFLFPSLLHQDPRYFSSPSTKFFPRMLYAASRVLVTRSDSGSNTVNTSLLAGTVVTSVLSNAYYPRTERSVGDTLNRFGGSFLGGVQTNILREFWPDITRAFHKHEPQRMKDLQESMEQRMPLVKSLAEKTAAAETAP